MGVAAARPRRSVSPSGQLEFPMTVRFRFLAALAAVAVLAAGGAAQAQSGTKKFKINGSGPADPLLLDGTPVAHAASGTGTFLGRYQGEGHFRALSFDPNTLTATFESAPTFTFTAANGDKLVTTYGQGANGPGTAWAFPQDDGSLIVVFLAEFNPVPSQCTGRFAGVTGSWMMLAISEPLIPGVTPFDYSWTGEGTLTFPDTP